MVLVADELATEDIGFVKKDINAEAVVAVGFVESWVDNNGKAAGGFSEMGGMVIGFSD